mmetsp:Transcript_3113/g.7993  ORF Transcript_3113/g.7993 Transcript_3113/m.7993 type:complete len:233 (+) Transcript_3113:240-938(+)
METSSPSPLRAEAAAPRQRGRPTVPRRLRSRTDQEARSLSGKPSARSSNNCRRRVALGTSGSTTGRNAFQDSAHSGTSWRTNPTSLPWSLALGRNSSPRLLARTAPRPLPRPSGKLPAPVSRSEARAGVRLLRRPSARSRASFKSRAEAARFSSTIGGAASPKNSGTAYVISWRADRTNLRLSPGRAKRSQSLWLGTQEPDGAVGQSGSGRRMAAIGRRRRLARRPRWTQRR